jgi:MFS family permease
VTETAKEQERAVGGPKRRLLPVVARLVGWLIVPLYIVSDLANYLLTYSVIPWSNSSLLDHLEGLTLDLGFAAFAVVGALLIARRPANAVGWIMASTGLMVSVFNLGSAYATYVMATRGRPDALAVFGAWAGNCYWFVMLSLALIYLPMLFPDGRLISRRWLPFALIGGIGAFGVALLGALADPLVVPYDSNYKIDNPIGMEGLASPSNLPVFVVFEILFAIGVGGAAASVIVRLRRSRGVERRQLEWFAYVTALFFGGAMLTGVVSDVSGVGWLGSISFILSVVGLVCLPIAVGIAVLKYRLYDIDIIINRTLVYGSLTLMLLLVYFGGVTTTQALFRTLTGQQQQPQLAVVVSTLAIAALFNPLRHRIQSFIDRRFFRSKYDARKTLESFSARLREETDLEALDAELVSVVRETMQPEHVSLWLLTGASRNGAREE